MHRIRWSLLQLLSLPLFTVFCQENLHLDTLPVERLLTLGYQALQRSQAEALPYFEEASRRDPSNRDIQEQVGYIDIALGRSTEALDRFRTSLALQPSDTTRLQIAYLLTTLGKSGEALSAFEGLDGSPFPSIRAQADAEAVILSQQICESRAPWWWKGYAEPYYDGRFNDAIINGALSGGRYLTSDRILSLFGMLSVTRDSRSVGGELPVIYADNYALLGAGVRTRPAAGLTAEIQAGVTQELIHREGQADVRGDFRTVASYGLGWYPDLDVPDRLRSPMKSFGDLYASYGYYSRYANTIGSLQLRSGWRVAEYRYASLDAYLRVDFTGDTRREYYNNILEGSVGVRLVPDCRWPVSVLAELHRGVFWGSSSIPDPYGSPYTSFRLFLIYDSFLCW